MSGPMIRIVYTNLRGEVVNARVGIEDGSRNVTIVWDDGAVDYMDIDSARSNARQWPSGLSAAIVGALLPESMR